VTCNVAKLYTHGDSQYIDNTLIEWLIIYYVVDFSNWVTGLLVMCLLQVLHYNFQKKDFFGFSMMVNLPTGSSLSSFSDRCGKQLCFIVKSQMNNC